MKKCFCIMPFDTNFDEIYEIVKSAAIACELVPIRGDQNSLSGSILPRILEDIRTASVIVADISEYNPNVFYELGIAHQLLGPDRVVIITREVDGKRAYDVHQFRQLLYAHNAEGRIRLEAELPTRIRKALESHFNQVYWNVIRGKLPRTRMIARDLDNLVRSAGSGDLKHVTIRTIAGLGSLAISDHEPEVPAVESEYRSQLLAERNLLRAALVRGAELKAVLNPPRRFARAMLPARLRTRFARLIGLLEGKSDIADDPEGARADLEAMPRFNYVLSSVAMPNVFIIGDSVAYEGLKRGGTGGFDMTHCETNAEAVKEHIQQFESFYEESRQEMLQAHPPDGCLLTQMRRIYQQAVEELQESDRRSS